MLISQKDILLGKISTCLNMRVYCVLIVNSNSVLFGLSAALKFSLRVKALVYIPLGEPSIWLSPKDLSVGQILNDD